MLPRPVSLFLLPNEISFQPLHLHLCSLAPFSLSSLSGIHIVQWLSCVQLFAEPYNVNVLMLDVIPVVS